MSLPRRMARSTPTRTWPRIGEPTKRPAHADEWTPHTWARPPRAHAGLGRDHRVQGRLRRRYAMARAPPLTRQPRSEHSAQTWTSPQTGDRAPVPHTPVMGRIEPSPAGHQRSGRQLPTAQVTGGSHWWRARSSVARHLAIRPFQDRPRVHRRHPGDGGPARRGQAQQHAPDCAMTAGDAPGRTSTTRFGQHAGRS